MTTSPTGEAGTSLSVRSTMFYRGVLVLPVLVLVVGILTGVAHEIWTFWWSLVTGGLPGHRVPVLTSDAVAGIMIWSLATMPLIFAAWELGVQHTRARRAGTEIFSGFRNVVRLATGRPLDAVQEAEFVRAPRDQPVRALLIGLGVAVMVPCWFAGVGLIPELRTTRGLLWLSGAGLLMGTSVYCRQRASAYLVDEPGRWDLFRGWRIMNTSRYAPAGRRFVRAGTVAMFALMAWWLGGGAVVMTW